MAKQNDIVQISNVNLGGLADSIFSGPANSVAKLIGFDIHTIPGLMLVRQKMTKASGATVTEFCKSRVVVPNGDVYWFSETSGKVWRWTKATGAWTLAYTTAPAAGGAGCLGAALYNNYVYWATALRLYRIPVSGLADWATNAIANWQVMTVGNTSFHPMKVVNMVLYIGDGYQIHQVDVNTFTANAFDLPAEQVVKCLSNFNTDLVVGTYVSDYVTTTQVARWNTFSTSFTFSDPINESGINAFLESDDANMLLVQAGKNGHFYYYNGQTLDLYKSIPGTFDKTNYGTVNPNAVATYPKLMLFGFSRELGNPADQGVYAFGRHNRNYPFVMDLSFPISQREDNGEPVLTGVEIGAIAVSGFDICVSWKRTYLVGAVTTYAYGVDIIDWTAKLEKAIIESRVAKYPRNSLTRFGEFLAAYYSLPAETSIELNYKNNYAASWITTTEVVDAMRNIVNAEESPEGNTIQLKAIVNSHNNDAPQLEMLQITPTE